MKKINIAIDGYSSCGKSTIAKQLAKELQYIFIDSGAMYRAITLFFLQKNIAASDIEAIRSEISNIHLHFEFNTTTQKNEVVLNGVNVESQIRNLNISNNVSHYAAIAEIRKLAVAQQQSIGKNKGVVMDGRDIGTEVFPDAELKLFMTATPEVRTERRYKELVATQPDITREEVRKNLEERDYIDSHREISPLRQADDAIVLDNSNLTMDEQLALVKNMVNEKLQ
ncbi:(d)CMP kinase [Rhizosphaericola mali]|uniref:Cytidylate kinase n=1 Tax=Rhizosphaericola mali TaxID=2545455 RepID=A0A5P2G1V6_9BACT|nr:(d)CMP kinase [Rhizosphaericola mali]QES87822.1 (d)CMP kinase [Rhizosphaericola mali]